MEQPKIYNNEAELINWLKYDLEEQRKEIAKNKNISLNDVKDEELVLHIGSKNNDYNAIDLSNQPYTIYNMYFNFYIIFLRLCNNEIIDNYTIYQICKYRINARHCIFNSDFKTLNVIFKQEVNFFNSQFNKKDNTYNHFSNCNFEDILIFYNCSFYSNFVFYNCLFYSKATFKKSKFYSNIGFDDGNIKDKIDFNNSFIKKNLVISCKAVKNVVFDNIVFDNEKIILSIGNDNILKINKLSFKNIFINGIINIQNVEVETADFKGSVINRGLVNPVNFKIDNFANRESALFLKNEAYARNNIIDALKYKAKEIEKHKEDLLENSKDYKDWVDIISIELSSLYSDNGLNWIKSFLYTILFPILFFTMSYNISCIPIFIIAFISLLYVLLYNKNISKRIFISAITYIIISIVFSFIYFEGYNNIDYVIKEFFSFIAPTNFSQILYEKGGASYIYNSKNILEIIFASLFYFLGKIAFWYGSVQTVQSFRKFSKKE